MSNNILNKSATETLTFSTKQSPYVASKSAIAAKVREDIHFLQDRIDRIKKLQTPNTTVLKTYQSMLESREAVLEWLNENEPEGDDQLSQLG